MEKHRNVVRGRVRAVSLYLMVRGARKSVACRNHIPSLRGGLTQRTEHLFCVLNARYLLPDTELWPLLGRKSPLWETCHLFMHGAALASRRRALHRSNAPTKKPRRPKASGVGEILLVVSRHGVGGARCSCLHRRTSFCPRQPIGCRHLSTVDSRGCEP